MRRHVERVLPYEPDQLFALVGDVARYPEFVPWITAMRTGPVRDTGNGASEFDAEAAVGFAFLKERFSTRVRREAERRHVQASLIRGPFRHLRNDWRFEPDPGGTRVVFDIDFAFSSRLLNALLEANVERAANRLIGCFEARAAALYAGGAQPEPAPA